MASTARKPRPTRRDDPESFAFTYRCPGELIGAVNEARHILREPSRTSLVTKAIVEYLSRRGIKT
jgi:hypothetical protein